MGEGEKQGFQLSFSGFLRVAFQGTRVTSNGGLLLVRELDERLGFAELIEQNLTDPRANNARFSFAELLRQSVYSHLAGYEDVNDAERFSGPGVAADRSFQPGSQDHPSQMRHIETDGHLRAQGRSHHPKCRFGRAVKLCVAGS